MDIKLELLEWDSEFFGVPIGRVNLDGADAGSIAAMEGAARDLGIACIYGSLDPADLKASYLVQPLGYRFVECATSFVLPVEEQVTRPVEGFTIRPGLVEELPMLTEAISLMAPWSRFATDPHFGLDAARRMHLAWIERAARNDNEDYSLLVAEDDEGLSAFMSLSWVDEPNVDTVGTLRRGSGAAQALMAVAREWAAPGPLYSGPAASRNVTVFRYVQNCGFRVRKVRYIYHRWLDEDTGYRS